MKMSGAICVALALTATTASAQDPGNQGIAVSGRCLTFSVASNHHNCNGFTYTKLSNGRMAFHFLPTVDVSISFSGGRDSRPSRDSYVLSIDAVIFSTGRDTVRSTEASGHCRMQTSDDGNIVHALSCMAQTATGPMQVEFRGDGKPAIRRAF